MLGVVSGVTSIKGHLVRMLREEGWRLPALDGSQGHLQSEADAI